MSDSEQNHANQDQNTSEGDADDSASCSASECDSQGEQGFTLHVLFGKKFEKNVKVLSSLRKMRLHRAVLRGDTDSVRFLLSSKLSPNIIDDAGDTPLLLAIRLGKMDMVQLLINAGADVNYVNRKSSTNCSLHDAIDVGYDMTKLLLHHGANPNQRNDYGSSALYKAASIDHSKISILCLLIARGADMYNGGNGRYSPFTKLISRHWVDGLEIFFKYGFDVKKHESSLSPYDLKPLHQAINVEEPIASRSRSSKTILSCLMDHYKSKGLLDLECVNQRRQTLLEAMVLADLSYHRTNIQVLVEAGAELRNILSSLASSCFWEFDFDEDCGDNSEIDEDPGKTHIDFKNDDDLVECRTRIVWKKARCIVRYRVLFESTGPVKNSEQKKMMKHGLLDYYKKCKSEIARLEKSTFYSSVTYHTVLTDEGFWRRVTSASAYKNFDLKKLNKKFPIYSDDLRIRFLKGKSMFELWSSAMRGLKCLLGASTNLYHVFSSILNSLCLEDLHNLSVFDTS